VRIPRISVRARLTLWYAATLGAILILLAVGIYELVRLDLMRQASDRLEQNGASLVEVIQENRSTRDLWRDIEDLEDLDLIEFFHVSRDGEPFFVSREWRRAALDTVLAYAGEDSVWTWRTAGQRQYIVRSITDVRNRSRSTFDVAVAEEGEAALGVLTSLRAFTLAGLLLGILLAAVGGYFLSGRLLRPVGAMASAAEAITARRLSERLPVHNPDDEFGRLAAVFNSVLGRLEESFAQLRRFTGDVSHSLRTPLTAIRSMGEVLLRKGGDLDTHRTTVASILEESDRLRSLVDDLLSLTRAEAGELDQRMEPVDVAAVCGECVESLAILAEEKRQDLKLLAEGELEVPADRGMLRHAVLNLLDNAIRYTPEEGEILVSVFRSPEGTVIEVKDDGPGISSAVRGRIFERGSTGGVGAEEEIGTGLGLAVVRWIAELHRVEIEVESRPGEGSTFRLLFPPA